MEGIFVRDYSLSHVGDQILLRQLASLVARDRTTTAEILAHIAEVDARKLYLEEGCSSMFTYCQHILHFAEGVAYNGSRQRGPRDVIPGSWRHCALGTCI